MNEKKGSELRAVRARTSTGPLAQTIEVGTHTLRSDEPRTKGGDDTGPAPHELLLSSLAACVAMTVQGYAARKGMVVRRVEVSVKGRHEDGVFLIEEHVEIDGDLDETQRARLLEVAGKCPVTRTLSNPIRIQVHGE